MKSAFCILLVLPLALGVFDPNACFVNKQLTGPYNFKSNSGCSHFLTAPVGSMVNVQCSFKLNGNCIDKLVFSRNGNFDNGYSYYCNEGIFNLLSTANKFAIGADFSSSNSQYNCTAYISTPLAAGQCDCGWRIQQRISGGRTAGVNEYPFMARVSSTSGYMLGGAVIISIRHALTTVSSIGSDIVDKLVVGEHDTLTWNEAPSTKQYQVWNTIKNNNYNSNTKQFDIAILETSTDIAFGPTVGPICLPFGQTSNQFVNSPVEGLGWGGTDGGNGFTNVLKTANFTVLSNVDCKNRLPLNNINEYQLCALSSVNDMCRNDAGGPLIRYNPSSNRYMLVGLISYGLHCEALIPSVHTRVASFLGWIQEKLQGTNLCMKQ